MEIESTIQPDVPVDTPAPDVTAAENNAPPPKTERELLMEAIEARHHQQLAQENGIELDPEPVDQLEAQLQNEPAPEPAPAPAAPVAESALPPVVKVKVDGVEAEVPLDEVVRNYQKTASADRKLREAAELSAQIAAQQQQLALQQQQWQLQQQQQAPAANPNSPESSAPDASGKEFLKALFEGDEETALAKLTELTQAGRQAPAAAPIPDLDQLASVVTQHVQQKLHVESALAQHRKDYPQVYADPDMEGFVLAKVNSVRRDSGADFFTALNQVSSEFATKFGWNDTAPGRSPDTAPTTINPRAAKLERKAQIDNLASVNTKTGSTETVPQGPSDIIAEMRRQRGY